MVKVSKKSANEPKDISKNLSGTANVMIQKSKNTIYKLKKKEYGCMDVGISDSNTPSDLKKKRP